MDVALSDHYLIEFTVSLHTLHRNYKRTVKRQYLTSEMAGNCILYVNYVFANARFSC